MRAIHLKTAHLIDPLGDRYQASSAHLDLRGRREADGLPDHRQR